MNKGIIILGSSRSDGDTAKVAQKFAKLTGFDTLDLLEKNIGRYDYEYKNSDDDFLPVMRGLVENYETFVFATPVYWYTMSGIMKDFFDRISDCIRIEKETGRKLRGKSMAMISCSDQDDRAPHFNEPFVLSAGYLGMNYIGDTHTWVENDKVCDTVLQRLVTLSMKC